MNLSSAAIVDFLLGAVVFFSTFFADRRGEGKEKPQHRWLNFTLVFRLAGATLMILALWRIFSGRG